MSKMGEPAGAFGITRRRREAGPLTERKRKQQFAAKRKR